MAITSLLTRIGLGAATAATGLLITATAGLATESPTGTGHTPDPALPSGGGHCVVTADSAQHWITSTGHLPCPGMRRTRPAPHK
jgi:hypothetical protein